MKTYCNVCNKYRKSKIYIYIYLTFLNIKSFVCGKCGYEYKKYLKKNIQMKY